MEQRIKVDTLAVEMSVPKRYSVFRARVEAPGFEATGSEWACDSERAMLRLLRLSVRGRRPVNIEKYNSRDGES